MEPIFRRIYKNQEQTFQTSSIQLKNMFVTRMTFRDTLVSQRGQTLLRHSKASEIAFWKRNNLLGRAIPKRRLIHVKVDIK